MEEQPTKKAKVDVSIIPPSTPTVQTTKKIKRNKVACLVPIPITFDCSNEDRKKLHTIDLYEGSTVVGSNDIPFANDLNSPHVTFETFIDPEDKWGYFFDVIPSSTCCVRSCESPGECTIVTSDTTESLLDHDTIELIPGKYAYTICYEKTIYPPAESASTTLQRIPKISKSIISRYSSDQLLSSAEELEPPDTILFQTKLCAYFDEPFHEKAITTLDFHKNGMKFSPRCTCNKGPKWCIHIVSTLLHISTKENISVYEKVKKNQVQELSRAELELFMLNSIYDPLEYPFINLECMRHGSLTLEEYNDNKLKEAVYKDNKHEIDTQLRKLGNLIMDAVPEVESEEESEDSDEDNYFEYYDDEPRTRTVTRTIVKGIEKTLPKAIKENTDNIASYIQRGDYDNAYSYLVKLTYLLFSNYRITMVKSRFDLVVKAWCLFILTFTCPYYIPPKDKKIDMTKVTSTLDTLKIKYPECEPQLKSVYQAFNGWRKNKMTLMTVENSQSEETFKSSPFDVIRFDILVMLGKTKEAICYARNVSMSKEAAELLLLHNNIDEAVSLTLDKSDLTASEAKKFATNLSKDIVGKFLVGLKAIPSSEASEIIPWMLELVYPPEKLSDWNSYNLVDLVVPFDGQPAINTVPSLLQQCVKHIAKNLRDQEMSAQKAVLDSLHFDLQKQILIELMTISACELFTFEDCKTLAAFFIEQNDYLRAFFLLRDSYTPNQLEDDGQSPTVIMHLACFLGHSYVQDIIETYVENLDEGNKGSEKESEDIIREIECLHSYDLNIWALNFVASIIDHYSYSWQEIYVRALWALNLKMSTEDKMEHFPTIVNKLSNYPEFAIHCSTFEKYALEVPELGLHPFITALLQNIRKDTCFVLVNKVFDLCTKYESIIPLKSFGVSMCGFIIQEAPEYAFDIAQQLSKLPVSNAKRWGFLLASSAIQKNNNRNAIFQWCTQITENENIDLTMQNTMRKIVRLFPEPECKALATKLDNNPHFQLALLMRAVRVDDSMFPQILDLATKLNRVTDLEAVFMGDKYKSFNLKSIVNILIKAKQYELALYVALIAFTKGIHNTDIPRDIVELVTLIGSAKTVSQKVKEEGVVLDLEETVFIAKSLAESGFVVDAISILQVVVKNPKFSIDLVTFEYIWELYNKNEKTQDFHTLIVENSTALRHLSKFYVTIKDYAHASAASYKAICTSVNQKGVIIKDLKAMAEIASHLSNEEAKSTINAVYLLLTVPTDIVCFMQQCVANKLEKLGLETVGTLLLNTPKAADYILTYCTLYGSTFKDLDFLFDVGLECKFDEYKLIIAQHFYSIDMPVVGYQLIESALNRNNSIPTPLLLWAAEITYDPKKLSNWMQLLSKKSLEGPALFDIAQVVLNKGHTFQAFNFAMSGFHYYKTNAKNSSRVENVIFLFKVVFKHNLIGAPSWTEVGDVLKEEIEEFIDWLSSVDVAKAYQLLKDTVLKTSTKQKQISNLNLLLKKCKNDNNDIAQKVRTDIFVLGPSLDMYKEIKANATLTSWKALKQVLLLSTKSHTIEYIDLIVYESDWTTLNTIFHSIPHNEHENIQQLKRLLVISPQNAPFVLEVVSRYVWRPWGMPVTGETDKEVSAILKSLSNTVDVKELEEAHVHISALRRHGFITSWQLIFSFRPNSTPKDYKQLISYLEAVYKVCKKHKKTKEFIDQLNKIETSQMNRSKCVGMIREFRAKIHM